MPGTDSSAAETGKAPLLVFGVVSDSHLRTDMDGRALGTPDRYFRAALECFRDAGVDAVAHCGDMADRGQIAELEFHAAIWNDVFPGGLAPDGRKVEKLFVVGNHDIEGFRYGLGCPFRVDVPFPDPEEATRHLLAADLAAEWERVWGEPYEPAWHKVVKGFHFLGLHWGEDEALLAAAVEEFATRGSEAAAAGNSANSVKSQRPFFVIAHDQPESPERFAVAGERPGLGFFGHYHRTASNWNEIHEFPGCPFPWVQAPSCSIYGDMLFGGDEWISPVPIEGAEAAKKGYQCLIVRVFDDRIAIERLEISEGGSLGPDWIIPLWKSEGAGALRDVLKKGDGAPQFRDGATIVVSLSPQSLRLTIPQADGNPPFRVYAYAVEVAGDDATKPLRRAVYAAGVHMGAGQEPDGGATTLEIPAGDLPPGRRLRVSVGPISSLGTAGDAISRTFDL